MEFFIYSIGYILGLLSVELQHGRLTMHVLYSHVTATYQWVLPIRSILGLGYYTFQPTLGPLNCCHHLINYNNIEKKRENQQGKNDKCLWTHFLFFVSKIIDFIMKMTHLVSENINMSVLKTLFL